MSKDFEQFLADERNYAEYEPKAKSLDPNVHLSTEQENEMQSFRQKTFNMALMWNAVAGLVIAPLTTIHVSLQLSVLPHKNKYGDVPTDEQLKALTRTTKDITPTERRKYELLVKSGVTGTNQPFRAPVYAGYFETIRALANQGFLGFFKGYAAGCLHLMAGS
jgi:hypothetical protein